MLSPSDSEPAGPDGPYVVGGPVGPYGTLSPSDFEPAGLVGPYVAGGPIGPCGTLPPSDSVDVGPVGPEGTLSSSDLAVPAGIPFQVGLVGPDGTLSPTDIAGILSPVDLADLITVGVADVTVVGAAPLVVTHVFTDPELVTDEVETVHESPVDYGDDYDDSDCKDIRNAFVTEEWVACYNVDASDGYCGFFPDVGEIQSPISNYSNH